MNGITSAAQRALHHALGEQLRWRKAFWSLCYDPATGGSIPGCTDPHDRFNKIHIEATVPAAARVLVSNTWYDISDPDFGIVPKGSLQVSTMPDELPLARFDQILLINRTAVARPTLARTAGTLFDALPDGPVVALLSVSQGATVYVQGTHYALNADRVQWLGATRPADGSSYNIEHTYIPTYEFLGAEPGLQSVDTAGLPLPQRGVLSGPVSFSP